MSGPRIHGFVRRPWDLPESALTDESLFFDRTRRREFLKSIGLTAGLGAISPWLSGCGGPSIEELDKAGHVDKGADHYPAPLNESFEYGRPETTRKDAAEFTNFYEFSSRKSVYLNVDPFEPVPWSFSVEGLCNKPRTFDLDDVYDTFSLEERAYRHRCVETWAMCVPWTGFPLAELLKFVEPLPSAKYVKFETFFRPEQAPQQRIDDYPWPYSEGLTIQEAMNPMAILATGIFGRPLLKQHGAPIRLVVPWKYGFKGIKSITRMELTDQQPATFWNTLAPHEYAFEANVDPNVPHPRWSQAREWMLGTQKVYDTVIYNGYGDYVGKLYAT
ncbi:MAG: protein-methionine-sulfoxide reductase catalytic subunit MsrP [Planctomycetaceae bacterium]|nr:protein-methionine-sulfoxide reductase catalytic subunit MsrP [Planctomycetaceae bacterium]